MKLFYFSPEEKGLCSGIPVPKDRVIPPLNVKVDETVIEKGGLLHRDRALIGEPFFDSRARVHHIVPESKYRKGSLVLAAVYGSDIPMSDVCKTELGTPVFLEYEENAKATTFLVALVPGAAVKILNPNTGNYHRISG